MGGATLLWGGSHPHPPILASPDNKKWYSGGQQEIAQWWTTREREVMDNNFLIHGRSLLRGGGPFPLLVEK